MSTKQPRIVSMTALKGGTGKTILTFNVATLLATKFKKKVLVIDIDPQHNMSNLLFESVSRRNRNSNIVSGDYVVEDIFEYGLDAEQIIKHSHIKNLDVIPTTLELTITEVQISGLAGRESILRNWIYDNEKYLSRYDYIFLDSNPTMSIININAFICCDSIVLVSDIDTDSIGAVSTFLSLYYPIRDRVDRRLGDNVKGLVVNKIIDSNNMTKDFLEYVNSDGFMFGDILLGSTIHHAVAIAETKITREPVDVKKNKRSHDEFVALIEEMLEKGVL